jgi:transcription elongation factor, mitochondrial
MLLTSNIFRNTRFLARTLCTTKLMQCSDLGFKNNYSPEETDRVLNAVNSYTYLELKSYNISQIRLQKILARREKQGNFKTLEDILELDGFGIKILEKFCNSIILSPPIIKPKEHDAVEARAPSATSNSSEESVDSTKKSQFITPALIEVTRNSVETIVSFHIDLNFFAWTKIFYNRDANEQMDEPKFIIEDW